MTLKDFICTDNNIGGVPFSSKIVTPKGEANVRTLEKLRGINYIVVHNTGNSAVSADDDAHAKYLQNVENVDSSYVSWHLTVDCDSVVQHLPFNEVGFHAGDGNGAGNREGIGVEIAENKDCSASEANSIKIICALMAEFSIPVEKVLPHRFFSSIKKLCPWKILKSQGTWEADWKAFQARILVEYKKTYTKTQAPKASTQKATMIMGRAVATAEQMRKFLFSKNKSAPNYVDIYMLEAEKEGVRADVAFAQSCLETGYFSFGGAVSVAQNNFAGLGATHENSSNEKLKSNSFDTPTLGIRAQIQHLKAYASKEALKGECVDGRFSFVERGSAQNVELLSIPNNPKGKGWANDKDYGDKIISILKAMQVYSEAKSLEIGSNVAIKSGAVYGGLSSARGKKVPDVKIDGHKYTIIGIATHYGVREARLEEINSWVEVGSLVLIIAR